MIKKIIPILGLTLITASAAYASPNGWYLGGQIGAANIDNTASSLNIIYASGITSGSTVTGPYHPSVDNGDWGGRIFTGYQFMPYLAAELGATDFANTSVDHLYGTPNLDDHVSEYGFDAVAKVMLPIGERFNVYAKGGVAYMLSNDFDGYLSYQAPSTFVVGYDKNTVTAFRPVYGLGASYDITPKLSADISWSQIVGGSDIPQTSFTALGLAYHFA